MLEFWAAWSLLIFVGRLRMCPVSKSGFRLILETYSIMSFCLWSYLLCCLSSSSLLLFFPSSRSCCFFPFSVGLRLRYYYYYFFLPAIWDVDFHFLSLVVKIVRFFFVTTALILAAMLDLVLVFFLLSLSVKIGTWLGPGSPLGRTLRLYSLTSWSADST